MSLRLYFCFAGGVPAPCAAQPLPALVEEALRHNREILAAQKKYEAARQMPAQASALADPTISMGYTANGAPYPVAGYRARRHQQCRRDGVAGTALSRQASTARRYRGERGIGRVPAISRGAAERHGAPQAGLSRTAPRQREHHLRQPLPGPAAENPAHLRGPLHGARAAQQDIFKAQTQFAIFETQMLRYEQERACQTDRNQCTAQPAAGRHDRRPRRDGVPANSPSAWTNYWRAPAPMLPMLAREQKMVERNDLASALARKSVLSRLHGFRRLLQPGQHAADVAVPRGFQSLPPGTARSSMPEITEKAFSAVEARHTYEAAERCAAGTNPRAVHASPSRRAS